MARGVSCAVRFGRFKWNRAGYADVMDGGGVQALVSKPAQRIAAACNADFAPHEGEGAGYEAKQVKGRLAHGYVVRTSTPHARASERKHNRLLRNFGGS